MCILGVNFRRLFPQNPSLLFVSVSGRLPCLLSELQAFFYSNTTPVVAVPFCFFSFHALGESQLFSAMCWWHKRALHPALLRALPPFVVGVTANPQAAER
eukprot:RCo039511